MDKDYFYDLAPTSYNSQDATFKPEEFKTNFWDYSGAVISDTWNNGTITGSLSRSRNVWETMSNVSDEIDYSDSTSLTMDVSGVDWETPLTVEQQQQRIKELGMEGRIEPYYVEGTNGSPNSGYNERALQLLTQQKKDDDMNAFLRQQAPAYYAPFGFAAMLGTSMLDVPMMVATMGVPVLGQSKMLQMLRTAETAAGRTGVRALQGAISGATGMAMIEPILVANKLARHDEWSPWESVLNIGVGAVIGAGLHSAFGGFGEYVRNKRGQRHPWQILTPDGESERLRVEFRNGLMETVRKVAGVNENGVVPFANRTTNEITEGTVNAISGQFDVIARTIAYDTNKTLPEVYAMFAPTFDMVKNVADSVGNVGFSRAVELAGQSIEMVTGIKPEVVVNELGKAAIKLFQGTTSEDVQRAFFSGYRLLMSEIAKSPDARPSAKLAYSQMEQFVGAESGATWTPQQEIQFQNAAMAFLQDERAVPANMEASFERLNQFMREMKLQAENTGVPIPRELNERLETLQASLEERDGKFAQDTRDLILDRDMGEPRGRESIEGIDEPPASIGDEIRILEGELVDAERTIATADEMIAEIEQVIRDKGYSKEQLAGIFDQGLKDEAMLAEMRKTAMEYFNKNISKEQAMQQLECYVELMISRGMR